MKQQLRSFKLLTSTITFFVLFSLFSVKIAFSATFSLSGRITDSSGTAISAATIDVLNPGTTNSVGSTTSDPSGDYNLNIDGGTYDVKVTPPPGSNFSPVVTTDVVISSNTILDFALVPVSPVNLSGTIRGPLGNPLASQTFTL